MLIAELLANNGHLRTQRQQSTNQSPANNNTDRNNDTNANEDDVNGDDDDDEEDDLVSPYFNPLAFLSGAARQSSNPAGAAPTSMGPNLLFGRQQSSSSSSSATGGADGATSGASATTSGPTRVQVIMPGEQFDLYGIINSVLTDVFRQNNPHLHVHQAPSPM